MQYWLSTRIQNQSISIFFSLRSNITKYLSVQGRMTDRKTAYLKHQLNNSPSKVAYTFSKIERFPVTHEAQYSKKKTQTARTPSKSPSSPRYGVISRQSSRKKYNKDLDPEVNSGMSRPKSRKQSEIQEQKSKIENQDKNHLAISNDGLSDHKTYSNLDIESRSRQSSRLAPPSEAGSHRSRDRQGKKSPGYTFSRSPRGEKQKIEKRLTNKNGPGTYERFSEFGSS